MATTIATTSVTLPAPAASATGAVNWTAKKITDQIIKMVESTGLLPWECPWSSSIETGGAYNATTKRAYTGLNAMILAFAGTAGGFSHAGWVTYAQAIKAGGHVKKGEHGIQILKPVFKKVSERDEDGQITEDEKLIGFEAYVVFNVEQTSLKIAREEVTKASAGAVIPACDAIVAGYKNGPKIAETGAKACYFPLLDVINVPVRADFTSVEMFYVTLFHEMVHSTGASSRLGRLNENKDQFEHTKESYAFEELVADIGAAMLASVAGIGTITIEHNAAYVKGWLKTLASNTDWIIKAAGKAEKAVKHILGH